VLYSVTADTGFCRPTIRSATVSGC